MPLRADVAQLVHAIIFPVHGLSPFRFQSPFSLSLPRRSLGFELGFRRRHRHFRDEIPSPEGGGGAADTGGGGGGTRDAESLFRTKPIPEIRAVEASVRREIQEKKEELRQLVGRSYRDLIDSADSILLMKSSCESISSNLAAIDAALASSMRRSRRGRCRRSRRAR
uniref:Conserved oligomeric Golgi complex subunit 1 n=1 Tax=Ananas comosus var. bracteatus TaxID=296719 RepID=A0A6V7NIH1_ANACO|nr:unnamed protein product [Ananas comosus var. bracteatus]